MTNQQEQNESRGARLMRKMAGQKEDAAGGDGGGTGASFGGNAGLSQMGAIPNPGLGVVKGQKQAGIQCPACHEWTNNDNDMCEQCGTSLTQVPMRESTGRSASDFAERFNGYRQRQAGVVTLQEQRHSRENILDEIASHMTALVRDMSPDLLPYEDTVGEESLHERIQSMLEGFVGWKSRRKRG